MSYQCAIADLPPQPTLSVRARTSVQHLPEVLRESWVAIAGYPGKLEEQPSGPPFVAYFTMDMQDLQIAVGFPVARALPGEGAIVAGEMPAGRAATCEHVGP